MASKIDAINFKTDSTNNTFSSILDLVYPTGSVIWRTNTTNPSSLLGGTWSMVNNGRQDMVRLSPTISAHNSHNVVGYHFQVGNRVFGYGWFVAAKTFGEWQGANIVTKLPKPIFDTGDEAGIICGACDFENADRVEPVSINQYGSLIVGNNGGNGISSGLGGGYWYSYATNDFTVSGTKLGNAATYMFRRTA